jgi:hypothetical protein
MLRAFKNRVLILRPEMEEVTQDYKILHNYELQYSGVPRNFFGGKGVQQIQLRTERTGNWGH